jgi:hypothetical protein
MCRQSSLSTTAGGLDEVAAQRVVELGALPPNPRDLSLSRQNEGPRRPIARPPLIPAAESALGLRPRSALSSAQVLPEWILSTLPCNDFSANGANPLNSLSHPRGSVHLPCFFLGVSHRGTTGDVGGIGGVSGRGFFDHEGITLGTHFRPAFLSIAFRVPVASSFPAFPGTVMT